MAFVKNNNKHECVECLCVRRSGAFDHDGDWKCTQCWKEQEAAEAEERAAWAAAPPWDGVSDRDKVVTPAYISVLIRGQTYWARRDNDRTLSCWHRYVNVEFNINDFMGYWDTTLKQWDSE